MTDFIGLLNRFSHARCNRKLEIPTVFEAAAGGAAELIEPLRKGTLMLRQWSRWLLMGAKGQVQTPCVFLCGCSQGKVIVELLIYSFNNTYQIPIMCPGGPGLNPGSTVGSQTWFCPHRTFILTWWHCLADKDVHILWHHIDLCLHPGSATQLITR